MIESIQLADIIEYGVVAVVLLLWIQSLRFRLNKREEHCERVLDDYINYLKSDRQRQSDINAEARLGQRLNTIRQIDTQPIPPLSDINASAD